MQNSYIDRIKGAFKLTNFINLNVEKEEGKEETTESTSKKKLTPKEKATKAGEPWFTVIDVEIDPDNPRNGSFELDWNKPFVEMLRKHGLVGDGDEDVIDQWFQDLCKQIALDSYEGDVFAESGIQQTHTADGRTEYK